MVDPGEIISGGPTGGATLGKLRAPFGGFIGRQVRPYYLLIACCLPMIVLLVGAARRDWYPTGDLAHTELMIRAIPEHPPLVGVAARVGPVDDPGSAPGPSMAYLAYPVYWLLGSSPFAMLASINVLHVAGAALGIALAARQQGRLAGLAVGLGTALMFRSLMPDFFLEPWNVWVPVFAFLAYLVVLWDVAQRRTALLPLAVALGAHCAQTHVSYLPLVGGTMSVAAIWLLAGRHRLHGRWARDLTLAALVGVLALVPPVIDQLRPGTGNLARLWRHFTNPPDQSIGVGAALKGFFGEYNLLGPWILGPGHEPTDAPNWPGAAAMLLVVLSGLVIAVRRRDRPALELYGVVVVATAVGVIATTRIFGGFYSYLLRWIWPLNALSVAAATFAWVRHLADQRALAATTDDPLGRPLGRAAPRVDRVLAAAVAGLLLASALQAVGAQPVNISDSRLVGGLAEQLTPRLSQDARYLLRWHDPAALGGVAYGLVLEMERRGFHLGVDPIARAAAQPFRVQSEETANAVLWFVTGEISIARFMARSGAERLAAFDPRSPSEQRRSDVVRAEIEGRLEQLGRADLIEQLDEPYGTANIRFFVDLPTDLHDLVVEYNDLRVPGAVFEVPVQWGSI